MAAALSEITTRRGWAIQPLSLNDSPSGHALAIGGQNVEFRGFGRDKLKFVVAAIREANRHDRSIILAAHPHLAPPAACAKFGASQARMIVVSHGVEVWKPLPWLRGRCLRRADVALAPSRDTAEKLAAVQGVAPEKIRVLAWPLSSSFLEMANHPATLPLPPSFPSGRVILTVGRWAASERYKGVDDLIRAAAQLRPSFPGLQMVAVGDGDDLPRLRQVAAEAGATELVHFLRDLSREQLAACYAQADIFALPSSGEGFGLVFLEAMAFGKPVVGASCGGTTDVVEDGVNGLLVPTHNPDALAGALGRLLASDSLREQLGRRGAELVRSRYSFEVFVSCLETILERCSVDSAGAA